MSLSARDKAIQEFKFHEDKHILLASLKCGGRTFFFPSILNNLTNAPFKEGLNLMMASRVIVIDPWWNNAVEQQGMPHI